MWTGAVPHAHGNLSELPLCPPRCRRPLTEWLAGVCCVWSPRVQSLFYSDQSRTGKKTLVLPSMCVSDSVIWELCIWCGRYFYMYVYMSACVHMYPMWGIIYSLHAAGNVSLYSPPWVPTCCGPRAAGFLPPATCKAIASQVSWSLSIKQRTCKTRQPSLWCISYLKMVCLIVNVAIVQPPFLPPQPGIAHHFLWFLPHKGTLKLHALKNPSSSFYDGVWINISSSCCLPPPIKSTESLTSSVPQPCRVLFCSPVYTMASTHENRNEAGSKHNLEDVHTLYFVRKWR